MNVDANILNKIISKQIQQYVKKAVYFSQIGFMWGFQGW